MTYLRTLALLGVVVVVALAGAVGLRASHPRHSETSVTSSSLTTTTSVPAKNCLARAATTATTSKVMIIWEENKVYSDVIGNHAAPYINSLVAHCANAKNYVALTNPSLPNYMSTTSGVNYAFNPWYYDCSPGGSCFSTKPSIFSQLGSKWKSYVESMPANCDRYIASPYATKHNPAVYYTNVATSCAHQDVPLGTTTSGALIHDIGVGLATFTTVTPSLNNDMHDGSIAQGDNWLKKWIPLIAAGPDYRSGKLAVLIIWDEGYLGDNHSIALGLSAHTKPATTTSLLLNDYSVLRTVEDIAGVPRLGNARTATSMVKPFGF